MASVNTAGVTKSGPLGTFFYAYDETGLFHNGHRDYNPATGRYIQPDPIGLEGGINRYGYVGGNPVSFVDPLGLERFLGEDKAVDFLRQNKCNTQKAWEHLQMYRKSYPGLLEEDRNGEHYLYARWKVESDSYKWGQFHVLTTGYHTWKFWSNALLGNQSPYRGSPPTFDEMMAGHYGTNDGLWGGNLCECK